MFCHLKTDIAQGNEPIDVCFPDELVDQFNDSGAAWIFTTHDLLPTVNVARQQYTNIKVTVLVESLQLVLPFSVLHGIYFVFMCPNRV